MLVHHLQTLYGDEDILEPRAVFVNDLENQHVDKRLDDGFFGDDDEASRVQVQEERQQ